MKKSNTSQKTAEILCKRCGSFFETELTTDICGNDPEKVMYTNCRSCPNCGNGGYIEGVPVNIVNDHGELTAIISPMNDLFPCKAEEDPLVGFSVLMINENGIEIPYYASFVEWEVDNEKENKETNNGKVLPMQKAKKN